MDAKVIKSKIRQFHIKTMDAFLNVNILVMEHHCYYVIRRMRAILTKIPRFVNENA